MYKLTSILGNSQKLDGGAMFGNVPKALWSQWVDADEANRIPLFCRALLVQDGKRNILLEAGVGAFFEPKMAQRFGIVESEHVLLKNLSAHGLQHSDIDVMVLSHLHFDHAGGLLSTWQEGKNAELLFPNATYIVGESAWLRALNPHPRDRASFIPELCGLLQNSGRLEIVTENSSDSLGADFHFHLSDGHTPGLLLTEINMPDGPVVFAADLIPGTPWVHLPITMGYDRAPEMLIDEKQRLLENLLQRNGRLFFTHDVHCALARVARDEKGKFFAAEKQGEIINLAW